MSATPDAPVSAIAGYTDAGRRRGFYSGARAVTCRCLCPLREQTALLCWRLVHSRKAQSACRLGSNCTFRRRLAT